MPTRLQPGSLITTGSASVPGLNVTIGPNAPSYQSAFAVTDYNGYIIFWVTSKNNNPGAALVGGDNLVSCANVLAGSYICFHGGNEQYSTSGLGLQHVPANIWFPDGTTNQGAHLFTGTGAPSSSNIQGSAQMATSGAQTGTSAVASGLVLTTTVNLMSTGGTAVMQATDGVGNAQTLTLSFTGLSGNTLTGCAIVSGTSSWNIASGTIVTCSTNGWGELGDVYHRRDGSAGSRVYICTVAGQPGTWTAVL